MERKNQGKESGGATRVLIKVYRVDCDVCRDLRDACYKRGEKGRFLVGITQK